MSISKEEIMHVAHLARLELDDAVAVKFVEQIHRILEYVHTLNEVDTDGLPPTSHAISLTNAFREDEPGTHLERASALADAPRRDEGFFLVPKVVG